MGIRFENHPFSLLAAQIERTICVSLVLVCLTAAFALPNVGRLSLEIAPVLCVLTLVHNITLIALASRDRRRTTEELKGTLAPTATKAGVVLTWLLVALWLVGSIVLISITTAMITENLLDPWERFAACGELPLVVVETAVLVVLGSKSEKQRRSTMVQRRESVDWAHLRPPASARVV